jgi:prepilin-type N-terminal cleavage/methylation domain-containing protein
VSRRGLTLVEVVVAITLAALVATLAGAALSRAGAWLRDRSERFAAEHTLRTGAAAFRDLLTAAGGDDLLATSSTGLITRVVRGASVICEVRDSAVMARREAPWWRSVREPVGSRDSIEIGATGEPRWIPLALPANPTGGRCPDGGPGLRFPVALDPVARNALSPGSPLRFFEPVELRSYSSSGSDWLGARLVATGESIQPLAGPLSRLGLSFAFRNLQGLPAPTPSETASLEFRLIVVTPDGRPDSVTGVITFRGGWQ